MFETKSNVVDGVSLSKYSLFFQLAQLMIFTELVVFYIDYKCEQFWNKPITSRAHCKLTADLIVLTASFSKWMWLPGR